MKRQDKIDYIYKHISNKELKLGTLVLFEGRATPTRYLGLSSGKPGVIYGINRDGNKYHRRFSHYKIKYVYGNDVHIGDCLNRVCDDRLIYFINSIWGDHADTIDKQSEECLDFICLSIKG